jgi:hypothetical protein
LLFLYVQASGAGVEQCTTHVAAAETSVSSCFCVAAAVPVALHEAVHALCNVCHACSTSATACRHPHRLLCCTAAALLLLLLLLLLLQPFSYIGCALSTGLLCTAVAWVLFDFTDNPPPGGNFSSPRE